MYMAPVEQLKTIYGTDECLYRKLKALSFSAKLHFLKQLYREMRGTTNTLEITPHLFLLYCYATNTKWVLDANITTKSQYKSLIDMHSSHVKYWYCSCVLKGMFNDIASVVTDMIETQEPSHYAPATVKMINTELKNLVDMLSKYSHVGMNGGSSVNFSMKNMDAISSIENMDIMLTHELYQIDKTGMANKRMYRSASPLINKYHIKQIVRLLGHICGGLGYTTSNTNTNKTYGYDDIYALMTLYSFISKLYTDTHIRAFTIPSSENTTYSHVLGKIMHKLCMTTSNAPIKYDEMDIDVLRLFKKYKKLLSDSRLLRTATPNESIALMCGDNIQYVNSIENTTEEYYSNNTIGKFEDMFDIVLNRSTDLYIAFSLLYADLSES